MPLFEHHHRGRLEFNPQNVFERNLLMVLEGTPVPILVRRPDLPEELAAAIDRATARDPRDRFPTAAAFREALLPFARESPADAPPAN